MSNPLYTVSDEEKYFFDLRGYLIVRGALSEADMAECNAAIDHHADQIKMRSIGEGSLARGSKALKGEEGRRGGGGGNISKKANKKKIPLPARRLTGGFFRVADRQPLYWFCRTQPSGHHPDHR